MYGFVINVVQVAKMLNKSSSSVNKEIVAGLIKKGFHSADKIVVNPATKVHAIYGCYDTKEMWAGSYGDYHYNEDVQKHFEELFPIEYRLTFKNIKGN